MLDAVPCWTLRRDAMRSRSAVFPKKVLKSHANGDGMADEISGSAPERDPAAQKKFDAAMRAMDGGDFKKALEYMLKALDMSPEEAKSLL